MKKLSDDEINSSIKKLKGWTLDNNKLKKEFKFSNFKQSIDFLNLVEPVADSIDHHPDVCIYYNRVIVELTTHDIGGLSDLDFELAEKMDELSTHVKA